MRHATFAAIGLCLGVISSATAARGDEPGPRQEPEKISKLVEQLGAASYADREAASKALLDIGGPAGPALVKAAAGDDPEIRDRARKLLDVILPLAELASPDRIKRIRAAEQILDELHGDKEKRGVNFAYDLRILRRMNAALAADPDLTDSALDLLFTSKKHGADFGIKAADDAAKAAFAGSPVDLYLGNDFKTLAEKHPTSELAGKVIYDAGNFEDYLRQFPKGFYAPRAEYCLIAGKKQYAWPQEGLNGNPPHQR